MKILGFMSLALAVIMGTSITVSAASNHDTVEDASAVSVTTKGEYIYIRTSFNDEQDLVQSFRTYQTSNLVSENGPLNFARSYLVEKTTPTISDGITLSEHGDEATPFNFNNSYIGANHGQSDAIEVTLSGHGKTYADIGSQWIDEKGVKWDLLRVTGDTLMFLSSSEDHVNYKFSQKPSGDFTHVSGAVNTDGIGVSSAVIKTAVQVRPAIGNKRIEVYAVKDGVKCLLEENAEEVYCDYVVMEEYYDIINPSTIADALRENRPEGGYTENPFTNVGEPIVNYHMTHQLLADGTVIEIMDHKILQSVKFSYYGGIQYQQQNRAFRGDVLRYIPGIKFLPEVVFGQADPEHQIVSKSVTLNSTYWKDRDYNPDRQLDFIQNPDGSNQVAFAGGFLPYYYNETPEIRVQSADRWGFVYTTNKVYPAYITEKAGVDKFAGQEIKGVAYKKYFDSSKQSIFDYSCYTVDYDGYTFLYYDGLNEGVDVITLTPKLLAGTSELIYKTENAEYEHTEAGVSITTTGDEQSILVLKITPASEEVYREELGVEAEEPSENSKLIDFVLEGFEFLKRFIQEILHSFNER